jgi:hypothetical protein
MGLEFLLLVPPEKPRPEAPTLQEAEPAGNTSDVDVAQQLLGESAGGDYLQDVPLLDIPLPDLPLPYVPLPHAPLPEVTIPDVPLPNFPLAHVPLPETRPDVWVKEE